MIFACVLRVPHKQHLLIHPTAIMKSVAVAAFLALAATTDGFVVSPASTSVARTSSSVNAQTTSGFRPRRVVGAPVTSTSALKMSDTMNDSQQPTLEQVTGRVAWRQSGAYYHSVSVGGLRT